METPLKDSHVTASAGVLLLDAQLRLLHYTAEAASILSYPKKPRETPMTGAAFPATRSQLVSLCQLASPSVIEL